MMLILAAQGCVENKIKEVDKVLSHMGKCSTSRADTLSYLYQSEFLEETDGMLSGNSLIKGLFAKAWNRMRGAGASGYWNQSSYNHRESHDKEVASVDHATAPPHTHCAYQEGVGRINSSTPSPALLLGSHLG